MLLPKLRTQDASTAGYHFAVEKTAATRQAIARVSTPGAELQSQKAFPQSLVYCAGLLSPDGTSVECGAIVKGEEGGNIDHLSRDGVEDNEGVQSALR